MNQNRETSQEAGAEVAPVQPVNPWLEAARSIPAPAPVDPAQDQATQDEQDTETERELPVFVGAHGGAGATAWAGILEAVDAGNISSWTTSEQEPDTAVVLVLRASLDGVTAAKTALAHHGASTFTAGLVVAAGPGRTPRRINDELKILAGAVPLARAPWVPELLIKRAVNTAPTDLPSKELNKLTTTLNHHGVHTEGENK
ncbi:hypothetical protein [Arthrobacter rhombi]|uniref:hypothetical protein n=1 Tax=Arthrobacter rhombi TaxID=71253 RepID=UPI003FD2ED46